MLVLVKFDFRYWKSKFKEKPLTAFCTTMRADVSEKVPRLLY